MATDNPFAAPTHAAGEVPSGTPTDDAWAEGEVLVTLPEASLPLVCAKCGTHDDVQHVSLKMQWIPVWARLSILLSPLIYIVVFLIMRKRCHVRVGLCNQHRSLRMMGMVGGYGTAAVALVIMLGGFLLDSAEAALFGLFVGFILLLVGLVAASTLGLPLRVQRITSDRAEFTKAHPGLLRAVGSGR